MSIEKGVKDIFFSFPELGLVLKSHLERSRIWCNQES